MTKDEEREIWTNLRLKRTTKARIEKWGQFGESRDTILNKILDMIEGVECVRATSNHSK